MSDSKTRAKRTRIREDDEVQLYDPYSRHFTSQNRQNEFLKSLEEGQAEPAHSTIR